MRLGKEQAKGVIEEPTELSSEPEVEPVEATAPPAAPTGAADGPDRGAAEDQAAAGR